MERGWREDGERMERGWREDGEDGEGGEGREGGERVERGWREGGLTADEVTSHEDHLQVVCIVVLAEPQRVVLLVKLLPEVGHRDRQRVVVGVCPLPLVHVERPAPNSRVTEWPLLLLSPWL